MVVQIVPQRVVDPGGDRRHPGNARHHRRWLGGDQVAEYDRDLAPARQRRVIDEKRLGLQPGCGAIGCAAAVPG